MAGEPQLAALLQVIQSGLEGRTIESVNWDPEKQRFIVSAAGQGNRVSFYVGIESMIISLLEA